MRLTTLCALLACALLFASCDAGGSSMAVENEDSPPPDEGGGNTASIQITAEADGEEVQAQWSGSNLDQAKVYRLYRGAQADFDTTETFQVSLTATEYVDQNVETEQSYYYRVAAMDQAGTALALSESDEAHPTDETPPAAPGAVNGAGGFYKATLGWEAPADEDLSGYHVYRSTRQFTDVNDAERLTTALLDTTGFIDHSALDGERYVYRTTAVDESGNESEPSKEATVTPTFSGSSFSGQQLWTDVCSACHANADGWDLKAFAMPDTMTHRRALDHVNEQEAFDIISFLRSQEIQSLPDAEMGATELPPFQPGGRVLSSDKEFAINLFGQDQWPEDLTREELLGMHPTEVPIPLEMPRWSIEYNKFDWIADRELPDRIKTTSGFQQALDRYRENRSDANLIRLWRVVQGAKQPGDRYARFHQGVSSKEEFADVLEFNRWVSALIGSHAMRSENEIQKMRDLVEMEVDGEPASNLYHSPITEIWAVGDLLRPHGNENARANVPASYGERLDTQIAAAKWFYVSWQFVPSQADFSQKYFTILLGHDHMAGLKRLTAYVIAYTVVAGQKGLQETYSTMKRFSQVTPKHWHRNLLHFVLDAYIHRIDNGDWVTHNHDLIIDRINIAVKNTVKDNSLFSEKDLQEIDQKRQRIIDWIQHQKKQ